MRSVSWPLLALTAVAAGCTGTPFSGGDLGNGQADGFPQNTDGGTINPSRPSCPGQEATIQGRVLAPNGQDPVPGATVFIPQSEPELMPPDVRCEVCGQLGGSINLWYTTSKFDGSFTLTQVCPGRRLLVLQNGRFRRAVYVDVKAGQTISVPATQSNLPRRNGEGHLADAVPRIAVATGDYDKMECVLRKIGLADGSYDLYEGAKLLRSPSKVLPTFSSLVRDLNKMKQYNIIFINCTDNTFESELEQATVRDNISAYVRSGGRLYVTDWSYDWIERVPGLAPFVDFEPGASDGNPEAVNAAALGAGDLRLQATVKDSQMAQWLALFPQTINNDKVPVEHFLNDWVIMHKLHKDTKVWVEGGPIQTKLPSTIGGGTRPLTVTFNFENCGKILFSSYHTEGRDDELKGLFPMPKPFPQYCSAQSSPQDRILEYLIFDIASCVKPIG